MTRLIQRLLASAVLSISMVAATVGASYGQDKVVRIGFQKYGKLVLLKSKGMLEEKLKTAGDSVEWTEFPAGPQLLEALNVGAIDYGTTGGAPRSSRRPPARRSSTWATSRRPRAAKRSWFRRTAHSRRSPT